MKDVLLLVFVVVAYGLVGTWDFEDDMRVEQHRRVDRTDQLACTDATVPRAGSMRLPSSRPVPNQPIFERDDGSRHSRCHIHPEATHALN